MQDVTGALADSKEKKIVLLLCLLAAIRVFVFSAAFPFFNNVDEPAHFDLVLQYSHGRVPRQVENTSKEASIYLALFCSCAFFGPTFGPIPPPPWTQPVEKMQKDLAFNSAGWQMQKNYEDFQPPLYYAIAGFWWDLGKWIGLSGGRLLYWLRFLNILPVAGLVWLGYCLAALIFPRNAFVTLGVPLLLAFMPQTAFYSIGNDVLSPLCFGAVFFCLIKWWSTGQPARRREENGGEANFGAREAPAPFRGNSALKPSAALGAATGLAFAATYLSKTTNLPLLAVALAALAAITWRSAARQRFRETLPALAAFCVCAAPFILSWMIWCKLNFGDLTGSRMNMNYFGWTVKPFNEWWHHPIFSIPGFWTYLRGQFGTFWQGEFAWFHPPAAHPMALPGTDTAWTVLSLALLAAALPIAIRPRAEFAPFQRRAVQLSFVCVLAALGFFALTSIMYDFHNAPNPSHDRPYFHAGRLLLGMLIPFLLLCICGMDRLLCRFGNSTKFVALGLMVSLMFALEIATDWPAFGNAYNWFHLP